MQITKRPSRIILWSLPVIALVLWYFVPWNDLYHSAISWIFTEQRAHHKTMTENLSAFADKASLGSGWAIVFGSFLYGIFHAAGPGHGKVILSTYLVSERENVKRGIGLSIASALLQGAVAIILVYGLFYIFNVASRDTKFAVNWSERLAFAMVIGIGAMLVWRAAKALWPRQSAHTHNHSHDHGHSHDHHHHAHDEHGVCSTCGHAHAPSAEQVSQAKDWRTMVGIVFSIGLRPCSGAVLVLVFAKFAGIAYAGVLSVIAMSIGTAITVSALAVLAVNARDFALSLAGSGTQMAERIGMTFALIGGGVLIVLGIGLMQASFDAPVRSMGL